MNNNVIQIKDWIKSPIALKSLDRQIADLSNTIEDLLDSKEENMADLEDLLQWAVNNEITLNDPRLQNSFMQFIDAISLDGKLPRNISFDKIAALVEALDEVIIEKIITLTKKRLEALRLKWQLLNNKK